MMWIMFIIGLFIAFSGVIVQSSEENIKYKHWSFEPENLGHGLIWLGGVTSTVMIASILIIAALKVFV